MDLTWNMDSIYTSFHSKSYQKDMELLDKYIIIINETNIDAWEKNKNSCNEIERFLELNNEYKKIYSRIFSYAYLLMSADFENMEAVNALEDIENKNSELTEVYVRFTRWVRDTKNLGEIISDSEYILKHEFYIKELLIKSRYLLSEKEELIISKMQSTGAKAWEKLYMELVGTTTIDIAVSGKTEKLNLTELRNMIYEKEASIRKLAYFKESDLCRCMSKICAKCINEISGEASNVYVMRGYKSTLEKVIINSRMDFETLNVMMQAIKDSLPIFHKYYHKKAEYLGYDSKLPFYDIYAPIGNSTKKISYLDAQKLIESSFKAFSEKMAEFSAKAFKNNWIDAEPRKSKGNFGLEIDIFPIKECRIITNFNENYIDISVLAHEIGHGYHGSRLYSQTMLNTECPTPIAETASIFCETLVNNELVKMLPIKEALVILERSISDAAYYIVDFYGRYLFEIELFEKRKTGSLSVEELNDLMMDCMKRAYGDSIEPETIHPYMWMNKVGYFMAGNEFLNFPYSFGVLFSKGLYAEYIKRGQAFEKQYDNFLSNTSINSIVDLAKTLDVDVHSIDFWRNSLKLIEKDIEKFINII